MAPSPSPPHPPSGPARRHPSGAPRPLTSFIGREGEIAEVRSLLERAQLVSLTGAGGSGKTRLALEIALQGEEAPLGDVAWVDLSPLASADLLAQRVAAAIRPGRGAPRGAKHASVDALVSALRGRRMLLVLDGCEHMVDACARLADRLLSGCPDLRILLTSREALGIAGEHAWHVHPLSLPAEAPGSVEELLDSEAARLFVERARAARADFRVSDRNVAAMAAICRRLDGIPLAIELAAARVRALSAEAIAGRLDDVFRLLTVGARTAVPRHRTLRAAIDWSHELLSEQEKAFFPSLSVFRGGFTLSAAEDVCGAAGHDSFQVFELIARLVDRSLIEVREGRGLVRYHLLEAVRQYAAERLLEDGGADASPELAGRHARCFLSLAEEAAPHLAGSRRGEWAERLVLDGDNLRHALSWSREQDPALHTRLLRALGDEGMEALSQSVGPNGHPGAPPSSPQGAAASTARALEMTEVAGGAAAATPALAVEALGPLRVHREGLPLGPETWRLHKPRELLVYLLCHPQGRTRQQIGAAFWPEASPPQVKNSFHVTLHHLRKALGGTERVVTDGDRYRINPELAVAFDVTRFERAIVEGLSGGGDAGPAASPALEAALALYRGEFLQGEGAGDWHLEHRDRLRNRYVEGLLAIATRWEAAGRLEEAMEALHRVIGADSLREEAHRALMRCQVRLGRRPEALRHHEHLVALLREEFDSTPEPATTELAERVRQGGEV